MAPRKPINVGTEAAEGAEVVEVVETPVTEPTTPENAPAATPEADAEAPAPDDAEGDAEDESEDAETAPASWVITAPDDRTATVAGVRFEDGTGHTTDPTRIAFFERRGWGIAEA